MSEAAKGSPPACNDQSCTSPDNVPKELKSRLKASYDAIARPYNEWTIHSYPKRLRYLEQLLPHLASKDKAAVLELGCGAGIPCTQKLASYPNIYVTANDLSGTQLALARENLAAVGSEDRGCRVMLVEGDMMGLQFPAGSFDAVVALYSVIHLPRDEQAELIGRITRWLKPGGWVLANFTEEELAGCVIQDWLEEGGWMFWSGWGVDRTCEIMKGFGFEILVRDVVQDVVDGSFLWLLARKGDIQLYE
jgi:ubiquinone/menaquinone biosynthesis C-methylase UbiE